MVAWSIQAAVAGRERGGQADPIPTPAAGAAEVDDPRDQLLDLVLD